MCVSFFYLFILLVFAQWVWNSKSAQCCVFNHFFPKLLPSSMQYQFTIFLTTIYMQYITYCYSVIYIIYCKTTLFITTLSFCHDSASSFLWCKKPLTSGHIFKFSCIKEKQAKKGQFVENICMFILYMVKNGKIFRKCFYIVQWSLSTVISKQEDSGFEPASQLGLSVWSFVCVGSPHAIVGFFLVF